MNLFSKLFKSRDKPRDSLLSVGFTVGPFEQ